MLNSSDVSNGHPALSGIHCPNITRLLSDYLSSLNSDAHGNASASNVMSDQTPTTDASARIAEEISQRNAVIYIVVVLFFYSFGIGLMMIKYMRKEAEEQEEFKMYHRYMNGARESGNSTNRARIANRLALQALNMVNAIPQTSQAGSKVTFV